jgi:hypothetical protein
MSMTLFAELLAVAMAFLILWMIRRDRLPVSHSLWWLSVSVLIAIFGFFPSLLDKIAAFVGIAYPPSLLFIVAILTLLIKVLLEDLEVSTNRRRLLKLAQKTAVLEEEIHALRERVYREDTE